MNVNKEVRVINNIDDAEKIWRILSPNKVLMDDWTYNMAFYAPYVQDIHFYVCFEKERPVWLLPLILDTNMLSFFPSKRYQHKIFFKPWLECVIPILYEAALKSWFSCNFSDILWEDSFTENFTINEFMYVMNLEKFSDGYDFIEKNFNENKETKRKLKQEIKKIEESNVSILFDAFEDINLLFSLSINKFWKESDFFDKRFQTAYKNILKTDLSVHSLTVTLEWKKEAFAFIVSYNNIWYNLNNASNFSIPNLWKYISFKVVDTAIKCWIKELNVWSGDCNRKEKWKFKKIPLYSIRP